MKKILLSLIAVSLPLQAYMLNIGAGDLGFGRGPKGSILNGSNKSLVDILSIVQEILLKGVIPIIIVGTALYIAYNLLTAEGDETRMKQAWKSLTYSAIALVIIALSYALVSILANLSLR